jgi:hypothetical protein
VADADPDAKPAVLQDTRFVVEEGLAYRSLSRAAIWLNKMWLAALVLLAIWLVVAAATHQNACATGTAPRDGATDTAMTTGNGAAGNGTAPGPDVPAATTGTCSVFLTPTSLYLGAMTILAFALQITCGLLGNAVGRKILESTPAAEEVGARKP